MDNNSLLPTADCRLPTPLPSIDVSTRVGTMEDLPFIDRLQKMHSKMVGFMQRKALEGKINLGHILVAEDESKQSVGYCIGNDQYFKHDDIGIIYQLNVVPGKQRGLIGATLLKAQFEKSAYGCKLYCCWCAQDIEANRFWESMGFVALAFRTGSAKKSRVHIFWQKRIRQGDTTTPWWFPSQTSSGSIREDRLVLPIPPGKCWSDEMPRILPKEVEQKKLPTADRRLPTIKKPTLHQTQFGPPRAIPIEPVAPAAPKERPKKQKVKNDPRLVAAARELRDRYLEQVNENPALVECGKYDVSRMIDARVEPVKMPVKMLAA
jgi:hypothetical protein